MKAFDARFLNGYGCFNNASMLLRCLMCSDVRHLGKASSQLFTAPFGLVVRHNWFKETSSKQRAAV